MAQGGQAFSAPCRRRRDAQNSELAHKSSELSSLHDECEWQQEFRTRAPRLAANCGLGSSVGCRAVLKRGAAFRQSAALHAIPYVAPIVLQSEDFSLQAGSFGIFPASQAFEFLLRSVLLAVSWARPSSSSRPHRGQECLSRHPCFASVECKLSEFRAAKVQQQICKPRKILARHIDYRIKSSKISYTNLPWWHRVGKTLAKTRDIQRERD